MEGSKRTTNHIGHFPLKQKASKKQKRYNLMTECLLPNSTRSRFKLIMTLTRGKTCVAFVAEMEQ